MGRNVRVIVVSCALLAACEVAPSSPDGSAADGSVPRIDAGPRCEPRTQSESACGDRVDDDCDGFVDCLDPQCEAQSCGGGLTCISGGCLMPCDDGDEGCLPPLGQIDNVRATVRGDNVLVDFSAVRGALDYRIYPYPDPSNVLVGADGEIAIENAIYRCAGDRPRPRRDNDGLNRLDVSLNTPNLRGYSRTESESLLGYVYLTPDTGRQAVYRVANPNLRGGYTWETGAPWGQEYNGAEYVVGTEARDALIARGWRDDGIAFYVAEGGTRTVYRSEYTDGGVVLFYADGPERDARMNDGSGQVARFRVLTEPAEGSVGLYRVFYSHANDHDVLAAGEVNRDRILYQGNVPVTALHWPRVTARTTFVIEALDEGCPYPGGFVSAMAAPSDLVGGVASNPRITLDDARLATGEVYVNGQHDPTNRPRAIARAFVTVEPEPREEMDWYMGFDEELSAFPPLTRTGTASGSNTTIDSRSSGRAVVATIRTGRTARSSESSRADRARPSRSWRAASSPRSNATAICTSRCRPTSPRRCAAIRRS
jgi:hypothetical protein